MQKYENFRNFAAMMPSDDQNMRKLMLIINPIAGNRAGEKAIESIEAEAHKLSYREAKEGDVTERRYKLDLRFTAHPGHATTLAREAVEGNYYGVVVCGGDGTVNEVARGICGSTTAMGIVPLGSGNGLARHLGIPLTIPGAFKVLKEDRILESDYATANGRPFFCTFGLGFDAEVTDKFTRLPGRGLKTYLKAVMEEFFSYQPHTYTIISGGRRITEKAMLVAVCNASQYGNNAYIAPQASIKDGLLDITIVHKGNLLENAIAAIDMLSGMTGKTASSTTFRSPEITIKRMKDGPAHFDGEPAHLDKEITIKCHHGAMRLFSTEKKQRLHALMAPEIPFISPIALTIRDLRFKLYNLLTK
ncbi:MAG: diacylglycerol kinase family lipid kinase [Muribaculaceae bacterium]|nr:diacylglycerol kinase family lipid kinase [Muribaculaceae bacterium]